MLPARLGPSEKRCVDLIGDWPWMRIDHLATLLGVSRTRLRRLLRRATELELLVRPTLAGRPRLGLSDRGLAFLARRDRTSVGELRKRWSAESIAQEGNLDWRDVKGTRSRQLLRNLAHTEAVHGSLASMAGQAHSNGWELIQLDPPQRASRYFRFGERLRSIQPDAFGVLRSGGHELPFFLEWERRAIRPSTMSQRLAPYLRYFGGRRPVEDHGTLPLVLVVFHDGLAADNFLRVARDEQEASQISVPLLVSDRERLRLDGHFGHAWRSVDSPRPGTAFG